MALSKQSKFWLTLLLTLLYMLVVAIVAFLNTVLRLTERPYQHWYHEPGLYAMAKGFNVFFGITVLVVIICVAYEIGDRILMIANLRERSYYNLYLFLFSATAVIAIPCIYMLLVHYHLFTLSPQWNNLYLLTLSTCLALHACIFLVLASFLLLTSLLTTLRSYNIFKYLVKLRRLHKLPPPLMKSALRQRPTDEKHTVAFQKQQKPLPSVIGRVPRRYQHRYQQQQQQQQQYPAHHRPSTPVSRQQRVVNPWIMQQQRFGSRTPSIPSTSWQSHFSGGSSTNTTPRAILVVGGHPLRRPATPSLHSQSQAQPPFTKGSMV